MDLNATRLGDAARLGILGECWLGQCWLSQPERRDADNPDAPQSQRPHTHLAHAAPLSMLPAGAKSITADVDLTAAEPVRFRRVFNRGGA